MAKPAATVSGLQPYPAYKPSGVEWLGDVPAHWEVRRLRTTAKMRVSNVDKHVREGEPLVRLCNYVDVYNHDYISQQIDFMRATATCKEIEQFRLAKGDVLITKDSEAWDDIGVPAVVTEPAEDLISGYHLALLRPVSKVLIGSFLLRALQSKGAAYQFHVEAKGVTRYGLSHSSIKSTSIAVPPLPEQAAIARYLYHADRRIRRCIQAKEKLVKLLEEQRQALINEAVTGRVDVSTGQPYLAYKPSGVEWLGDVPAHWEVQKLKSWLRINEVVLPEDTDPNYAFDYVDIGAVGTGFLTADLARIRFRSAPSRARRVLRSGDTIVSTVRTYLKAVWSPKDPVENLIASTGFAVLTPRDEMASRFVGYLCQSDYFADRVTSESVGIAYPAIAETRLGALRVCVPPLPEQAAISRFLDHAERRIQRYVESEQRQIHLLNEYRSRLIADVVTGKLDVVQAASGLPNDLEDPGAIT